ncbi:unnamed protein product [Clonostachys rosea]|uniref:Uncharacterized protein n=1 Tax=Bionectria ochroleuca TaxID=29856 RepID=A0ABY6V6F4_BIOOC|nr:unnamed protein product [Clonostachys rosea]
MGVNGLWTVVQPCARPTNLETLNRKRLAVDASIWIYQFLKAVRDKEGNALRNSHVVGFFRRICKLLWVGILPVFVFDGGAPALKRATIQGRKRRREGRREDAVKTAGKLLAVQMQRIAQEEADRRKRERAADVATREEMMAQAELPDMDNVMYAEEFGMSQQERQQARNRKFRKQDAYHLPELEGSMSSMGNPNDPRIMSIEELEEYARQFNNGEDVNLYDFSKIDFDGDFFKSLPPVDRYNILNAARLRSRLRMGLSKEQLDDMFPDRMAFSRFQIERVKERNNLTQRLMQEAGMTGIDLTLTGSGRIAGDKDREYILVKNDGVEGGWALGVVSKEKDIGEAHKPIDVDAIEIQYQSKDADEEDDDVEFEDVPIEGFNRLPKPGSAAFPSLQAPTEMSIRRQQFYQEREEQSNIDGDAGEESLFVGGHSDEAARILHQRTDDLAHPDEADDIERAIALSLQSQHGAGISTPEEVEDEDEMPAPKWTQRSVEPARAITGSTGSVIAHVVNNRASAAVPKRQEKPDLGSDSEEDMNSIMAKSRNKRKPQPGKPILENKKNPFDGPLPFPKLNFSSLFSNRSKPKQNQSADTEAHGASQTVQEEDPEDDLAGGFERQDDDKPKALPPWLADTTDIRDALQQQRIAERNINTEDRQEAEEEQRLREREMRNTLIEIESSSGEESDVEFVEIVEKPESPKHKMSEPQSDTNSRLEVTNDLSNQEVKDQPEVSEPTKELIAAEEETSEEAIPTPVTSDTNETEPTRPDSNQKPQELEATKVTENKAEGSRDAAAEQRVSESPEPEFEDVTFEDVPVAQSPIADLNVTQADAGTNNVDDDDDLFADVEYDEFSDPGDEELMVQLAEEAEEHARFASELNQKSAQQNKEDYERELRQLRTQQKKDRRDADEVTQVMITECQALLRLFGIPYITAPMEAEAQCAKLVNLGLVDGIVTDDSDTFLFGGTRVYKNMFSTNKFVECYIASDLEKELSLSRGELISLAQLLGSDYTEGISGVGPVTAVEILSEFPGKGGLESFREWWMSVQSQTRPKDADASSPFRKRFRKNQAAKLFLPTGFPNSAVYDAYLYPEVDDNTEAFQWGVPDVDGLRHFLMATIGWNKERTDEVLVPVIRGMNKRELEGTQSNITRFFEGSVGAGARDAFAPRQRAQGSKRLLAAVDKLKSNAPIVLHSERKKTAASKRKRNAAAGDASNVAASMNGEEEGEEEVDASEQSSRGKAKRTR